MSQVMCVNFLLRDIANLGHGRLLRYHHAHPPSLPPCPPPPVTSRWLLCTCAQRPVVQAERVRGHDERHGPAWVVGLPQLRHLAVRLLHCEQRQPVSSSSSSTGVTLASACRRLCAVRMVQGSPLALRLVTRYNGLAWAVAIVMTAAFPLPHLGRTYTGTQAIHAVLSGSLAHLTRGSVPACFDSFGCSCL